ncbi:MAG: anhydro-N-acetylmuramic acid kinase [Rhodospirillales bacterium]|nr:anhydro-N-acetylmuramic acid kinase [Rhodospirillales bacterium]
MSGTSLDGIDAALIRSDGQSVFERGSALTQPYDLAFRERLRGLLGGSGPVAEVECELTERHAAAVEALLSTAGLSRDAVSLVGFHGQTILHAPDKRRTWQIGDGPLLARLLGISVVNDFRTADVAAGGEGAPLVPVYQQALAHALAKPLAVLNIGGVSNVTWIGAEAGQLLACDCGPGNALLDDWMRLRAGQPFDDGGRAAATGDVDVDMLAGAMAHPYFTRKPPKSLDRDAFQPEGLEALSLEDGAASLVAFTVEAIRAVVPLLPTAPRRWLVTGGGRKNPAIMAALTAALSAPVGPVETVGWDGDAMEAEAFAFLAARALAELPLTFPGTTGVSAPQTGGRLHQA